MAGVVWSINAMKRREIFAGNWKMYKNAAEAAGLVEGILKGLGDIGAREVVVFPPRFISARLYPPLKGNFLWAPRTSISRKKARLQGRSLRQW
jgi:hypothetical protein